jgi:hypothetical protein
VHTHRRYQPFYAAWLGVALGAGVVMALTVPAVPVLVPTADPGPCGATGSLISSTCTYTTIGSDTFTVPAG